MSEELKQAVPQAFPARDTSKPAEQQGMFHKFNVERVDGSDRPGGKHHGCRYFVLDLDHDPHSKAAMSAYGLDCRDTHPKLSAEILDEWPAAPQAGEALTDERIELEAERLGARWNGSHWIIEDADLHPMIRHFASQPMSREGM